MLTDVLIPLRTHASADTPALARALLRLAATFATHATLCPLEVFVPPLKHRWSSAMLGLGEAGAQIEAASHEAARQLLAVSDAPAGLQLATRTVRASFTEPASPLAAAARYHDLTLIAFTDGEAGAAMAEAAMFGTGRPALLVPATVPEGPRPFARIAIAWDGSAPANRALQSAMPLLVEADDVIILDAPGDKRIEPADREELLAYFVRHGIAPRFASADLSLADIGLALQQCAKREGAGLLVMGAYGHHRVQQFILGGATRGVLTNLQLPVLMSHS
jgi:nucleotide-binding universal stress UspA family protein